MSMTSEKAIEADVVEKRQLVIKKLQEATEVDDGNGSDIFYIVNSAVNDFNVFLKNNKIDKSRPNCIQAVLSTIRFILFRPAIDFDAKKSIFSVNTIRLPSALIEMINLHLPLFIKFDEKGVKESRWAINTIIKDKVQLIVKVDGGKSETTISLMNIAANEARNDGWKGMLEIITASTKTIALPTEKNDKKPSERPAKP
jgi:hypothetical protein